MSINNDRTFITIFIAMLCFSAGFLSSPTLVSLFHIILIIPIILLIKGGEKVKIPNSGWILILLTLWITICNFVNLEDLVKTRKSFDEAKFYLSGVFLLIPFKYFFERADRLHLKKMLSLLGIVVVVAFIVGIVKAYFGYDLLNFKSGDWQSRSDGLTNYMRYGYASAFLFILSLSCIFHWEKVKENVPEKLFMVGSVLCFLAVFAAKTRGALLAILVGVPILLLKYRPKIALGIIGLGMIFVSTVLYFSISGKKAPSRFLNINDGSNKIRLSQFQSALYSIKEKPIFGLGASQLSHNVPRLKEKYDLGYKYYKGHAHNIFLEHAANYGVIGFLLYVTFLILWLYELYIAKDMFSWGIFSYVLAYIVSGQVENLTDNTNFHLFFYIYALSQIRLFFKKNNIKSVLVNGLN